MNQLLIVLGIIAISISYAIDPSFEKKDNASAIREVIQEANEMLFSSRELQLELLKDYPSLIPVLAEWEYQDWHHYDTSLTKKKLVDALNLFLNDDRLPLAFVILKDSMPVGVISLNDKSEPELSDLEDGNPWGGSFHVTPSERNRGLGEDMAKTLTSIAKRLGYKKIHFYTSNSQIVLWYTERGAKIIDTRPFHGHMITTMEYDL